MFPNDIAKIAIVSIENGEWHTTDFLLGQFQGWMDCPDRETGNAAFTIARALANKLDTMQDVAECFRYVNVANRLLKYAEKSNAL